MPTWCLIWHAVPLGIWCQARPSAQGQVLHSEGFGTGTQSGTNSLPCPKISCCALPVGSSVHPGKVLHEVVGSPLAFKPHVGDYIQWAPFSLPEGIPNETQISWGRNMSMELELSHCGQVLEDILLPCHLLWGWADLFCFLSPNPQERFCLQCLGCYQLF